MRFFMIILCFFKIILSNANEPLKKINMCKEAVNQMTNFDVNGIYGSLLEDEWHPAAVYILLKEMQNFKVVKREYIQKSVPWRFEFIEMLGGKTVVFVYNEKTLKAFCGGSNAFFVVKK